ncbi:hypothetical protein DCW30_14795 [Streptomyces alfalfae]|uniref:Uncharacterized protein n=1 Tax=Streptomyces alfalfae TaxID=1642299 RepID=A0A1P8TBZ7_9ACTN|nr:hypothetical protein [Streptomyces alfalfae]AYA15479.1 hypothetical protein D3X13_03790 [Streptomyces fradiae]APY85135.1 hypothetical protein A7J05_04775 [Streptomyces alfalfae]QQC92556.1 hypothetical protein I8755_32380 [Streptomyces alfalfae]RXX43856.1 hypothetical protein DCW30_14795 [Streptomyces alfalfae]RZM99962.1 hypothetical protein D4104_09465 [Streptomyces alfalfae]
MPLVDLSEAAPRAVRTAGADEVVTYPVSAVLSLHRERTVTLLRTLRSQHVLPALSHRWGSEKAYGALLHAPGAPLTVLDVPGPRWVVGLEQRVRALSNISAVMVLAPEGTDSVALLRAGAVNVVPRDTPPKELAGRIVAERRWLDARPARRRTARAAPGHRSPRLRQASQLTLMDIICSAARPWCCHELCLLLGTAAEPMNRRALRARVARLDERLAADGLSVDCATQWGRTAFLGLTASREENRPQRGRSRKGCS